MKGRKNSKTTSVNNNIGDRSIQNVMQIIDQLFKMRLIQHLSMPINKQQKLPLLSKFREKMNSLHALLSEIQKSGWKETQTTSTRDKSKSKFANDSKLETIQKDQIKKVQMAYNELFIEGSFKFYKKVATVFNFPTDLQPMDMASWARNYRNENNYEADCCQSRCCCN